MCSRRCYTSSHTPARRALVNDKRYLTTYEIKIVRIKQKRRNKTYNDNRNDIYDNNNINNKDELSLSNVKSDD